MHHCRGIAAALLAAVVFVAGTAVSAQGTTTRAVDPAKSKVQFSVQHIFVERVVGTVPIQSATLTLAGDSPIPVALNAVLDATKVVSGEPDRDASLQSPDFFDTKKFPTWTFTSTKIEARGAAAFVLDGTLTVHGVTVPEHLDVTVRGDAAHPAYHAVGHLERRAFKMAVSRLDPVIGTTVDLTLDIVLKPNA
jgi:polyisoprenoid-binding protein YceI